MLSFTTILITSCDKRIRKNGSGVVTTTQRNLNAFQSIEADGSYQLFVHVAEEPSVTITTDDNIMQEVQTFVQDGTLRIEMDDDYINYHYTRMELHVYLTDCEAIDLNGDVNATFLDTIFTDHLNYQHNGSGTGIVRFSGSDLRCVVNGSGRVEAIGGAGTARFEINGSGKMDGLDLVASNVTARINGSGDIYVNAIETLNAEIDGSGSIRYIGNPAVDSQINGSGTVAPY